MAPLRRLSALVMIITAVLLLGTLQLCLGWSQQPSSRPLDRRECLFAAAAGLAAALLPPTVASAADGAASDGRYGPNYCASGVGDGCEALAEGNAYIRSLQERSAANREKYAQEALDAYYAKNYPDFFAATGRVLVRREDGRYATLSEAEAERLRRAQKLAAPEAPRALGGRVTDVTQRLVPVLREE